jgi:hypothetical protein
MAYRRNQEQDGQQIGDEAGHHEQSAGQGQARRIEQGAHRHLALAQLDLCPSGGCQALPAQQRQTGQSRQNNSGNRPRPAQPIGHLDKNGDFNRRPGQQEKGENPGHACSLPYNRLCKKQSTVTCVCIAPSPVVGFRKWEP